MNKFLSREKIILSDKAIILLVPRIIYFLVSLRKLNIFFPFGFYFNIFVIRFYHNCFNYCHYFDSYFRSRNFVPSDIWSIEWRIKRSGNSYCCTHSNYTDFHKHLLCHLLASVATTQTFKLLQQYFIIDVTNIFHIYRVFHRNCEFCFEGKIYSTLSSYLYEFFFFCLIFFFVFLFVFFFFFFFSISCGGFYVCINLRQ